MAERGSRTGPRTDARQGQPDGTAWDRTLRNLLVASVLAIVGGTLLLARVLDPQETVIAVAVATGLLLAFAVVARPLPTIGPWAWTAVVAAFLLSRSTTLLASGRVYVVRDAATHIVGLPFILAAEGHLPGPEAVAGIEFYRSYPALHYVLASFHLVTGLPLWDGSMVLALFIGLGALAFIALATRNVLPQAGVLAGAGFVFAPLAASPHQALQPLSIALLCLAGFAYLLSRPRSHLEGTFFALTGFLLAATHPYSTAVIGLGILATVLLLAVTLRQLRFVLPLGLGAIGAVTYLGLLSRDFDRLLAFLSPPTTSAIFPGSDGGSTTSSVRPSSLWTFVETWKFRLPVLAALAGWGISFFAKPRKAYPLQVLVAVFGLLYLVSLAVPGSLPTRVLAIAAVTLAPFVGYALLRMTPAGAIPVVLICSFLAVSSVHTADQFNPWVREGQTLPHPLDLPAGQDATTNYFLLLEGGRLAVTNPISSHPMFTNTAGLQVRGFSGLDAPGTAPREYYIYRDVAEETGFSVTRSGAGERREAFNPYPTAGNLELLTGIDRILDVGEIQVHRN